MGGKGGKNNKCCFGPTDCFLVKVNLETNDQGRYIAKGWYQLNKPIKTVEFSESFGN